MGATGRLGRDDVARRAIGWSLVAVQFALLGLLIWPVPGSSPPAVLAAAGAVVQTAGLAVAALSVLWLGRALTPSPVPRADAPLAQRGPYRWVRHPIYSGLLLFAAGAVLRAPRPLHIVAALGLVALLNAKSRWEERMLAVGDPRYGAYAATVGRFAPRRRPAGRRPARGRGTRSVS